MYVRRLSYGAVGLVAIAICLIAADATTFRGDVRFTSPNQSFWKAAVDIVRYNNTKRSARMVTVVLDHLPAMQVVEACSGGGGVKPICNGQDGLVADPMYCFSSNSGCLHRTCQEVTYPKYCRGYNAPNCIDASTLQSLGPCETETGQSCQRPN